MKLKVCLSLILMLHFVVAPPPYNKWRDISMQSRRALGSAFVAAEALGVTFKAMISAQERINPKPNTDEYRVKFKALDSKGLIKHCQADVLWNFKAALIRTVLNAHCWCPKYWQS
ncbi:insoluble matrix shell protein 2-like [Ruditapes philippinarum]|uniref:insoluble matrix shell protein 2-like n=1 Tax=Ruditapes philippinarum TaxID=129788 RepID=UPI00295A61ED|nr:insoluble matrix shell protein 2-like [Ruditapes philippinarum]